MPNSSASVSPSQSLSLFGLSRSLGSIGLPPSPPFPPRPAAVPPPLPPPCPPPVALPPPAPPSVLVPTELPQLQPDMASAAAHTTRAESFNVGMWGEAPGWVLRGPLQSVGPDYRGDFRK